MSLYLTKKRRERKRKRQAEAQQDAFNAAYDEAEKRNREARRQAQKDEVFATTEGEGIMEGASISLGFNEDEEDELLGMLGTGLVV